MYKVSNITFRKKASTPGKLVKCFAFEISENTVAILLINQVVGKQ